MQEVTSIFNPTTTITQLVSRCIPTGTKVTLNDIVHFKCHAGIQLYTNHADLVVFKEINKENLVRGVGNRIEVGV